MPKKGKGKGKDGQKPSGESKPPEKPKTKEPQVGGSGDGQATRQSAAAAGTASLERDRRVAVKTATAAGVQEGLASYALPRKDREAKERVVQQKAPASYSPAQQGSQDFPALGAVEATKSSKEHVVQQRPPALHSSPEQRFPAVGGTLSPRPVKSQERAELKKDIAQELVATTEPQIIKEEIVSKMTGLSLTLPSYKAQFTMAKRPGTGKLGKPVELLVNYFLLRFKDIVIYHYDLDILEVDKNKKVGMSLMDKGMTVKESKEKNVKHVEHQQKRNIGKRLCREIVTEMMKSSQLQKYGPVYDGQKNVYTCKPFPFKKESRFNVERKVGDKTKSYCIVLKPVEKDDKTNVISLEPLREMYAGRSTEIPQEVLMAFETIMAHRDPPLTQVQVRSSFFFLNQDRSVDLGSGLEVWFGYNQSVRFTQRGPVVVINLAAKAFHKSGSVIDYANEILRCDIRRVPALEKRDIKKLEDALNKIRVEVTHQKHRRRYNVKGLSKLPAKDHTLDIENRKMTIAQFYAQKYEKLKYPHLPCLHMRTSNNNTFIPFENCVIYEGQPKIGKLDPFLSANMIRQTAIPPEQRFRSIMKDSQTVANICKKPMQDFGLLMDIKLMEVNGRVITSPALRYDSPEQQRCPKPDNRGVWRMEGKKFYRTHVVKNWILLSFTSDRQFPKDQLAHFASCLTNSASKLGLKIGPPCDIRICTNRDKTRDVLNYAKSKAEFAVIVLSRIDRYHKYEEVKFIADFELGLVTQCMEDKVVGRVINARDDQIANNVCLKLNLKLGGVNHVLFQRPQVFRDPCIVFGADAIHWPRGFGHPSIAAVVGSLDPFPSRYALSCRVQENRDDKKISQEIIVDIKDIVVNIFNTFTETCRGVEPKRIIFFRDGVSDGQFKTAHEIEVSGIQEASRERYGHVIPITYIIVQKRHQTRFRPKYPKDGVGKMGNIPPGTVVDTDVTHPVYFDYFLCSHEGIQGTSKPAHYTVIHDDNYLSADELQQLSYHLCHMYGKCNRSVSIPAPVYYAHLAAARAKSYADLFINEDDNTSSSSGSTQKQLPDNVLRAINGMKSFQSNMFYI